MGNPTANTAVAISAAAIAAATAAAAAAIHMSKRTDTNKEVLSLPVKAPSESLIVIVGCDRGFGRMLAERLVEETKFCVLALTLTKEAARELKERNESNLLAMQCDVTSSSDITAVKEYVEELLAKPGKNGSSLVLHGLVNNAAIVSPGDFVWYNDTKIHRKVMDVNYFGQLEMTQALLPLFLRTSQTFGGKRIVNISSVCGIASSPSNSAYSASKFAVEAWSDSLRVELEQFGISVVKVRPGASATSVQHDFVQNLMKNFQAAPPNIQERYGGQAYYDAIEKVYPGEDAALGAPPGPVIDTLVGILVEPNHHKLESSYLIGVDAHVLFRAMANLPTKLADSIKRSLYIAPKRVEPPLPPLNTLSHVTIRVRSLSESIRFYQAFGFQLFGEVLDGQQFLRGGVTSTNGKEWKTMILLVEDAVMNARGKSCDLGQTRLCIYTTTLKKDQKQLLEKHGLKPMAKPVDGTDAIAAYKDPDGFVVYLIAFHGIFGQIVKTTFRWSRGKLEPPVLFHWTVNVRCEEKAWESLRQLDFKTKFEIPKDKVSYRLLPAFGIPSEGSEIKFIRMIGMDGDGFAATLMEWVTPKSELSGAELHNSMALAVSDVCEWMSKAEKAGLHIPKGKLFEWKKLPVYGMVQVGRVHLEPDSNPIEFCCFTNKP